MMIDYSKYCSNITRILVPSIARSLLKFVEDREVISFAGGLPDPLMFPINEIKEIVNEVLANHNSEALQYMPSRGISLYLEELRKFLYRNREINTDTSNIVVTTGSQQALDLLGRVLLDEGEYIVVEDPTYIAALNVFKMQRVKIIGIPIDVDGMRIDVLEETIKKLDNDGKKIKFVYTIPIAQNPSGVTMSLERKKYLLELAEKYDFLIIEDDAYGMLVFDEHIDATPLYSLDRYGRVIYIGSLSKVLAPGLRLGHLVAPTPIVEMIEIFKQVADLHTSAFTQYIAAYAFKRKVIERNIQKIKTIYKLKRDTMIEALEEFFSGLAEWTKPIGGFFIWLKINREIDTDLMLPNAIKRGVMYVPGKGFCINEYCNNTIRLNFSFPSVNQIRLGIAILLEVIRDYTKG